MAQVELAETANRGAGALAPGSAAALRRELAVLALAALVSVAIALQFSRDHGKLVLFPFYDDVTYLTEAQKRVVAIEEGGLKEWPRAMLSFADPFRERSGFMINLAVFAFLVFGRASSWAPYLALTLFVFGALALLRVLFRSVPFRAFAVGVTCLLCVPVARGWGIEFRPDVTWGFGIALTVFFVLRELHRIPLRLGVAAAIATLFKPSALPVSAVVVLASVAIALVPPHREDATPTVRHALRFAAGYALGLVSLGFFVVPPALRYIHHVVFVAPEPWTPGSGLRFALSYYVTGKGGAWAFGALGPAMLVVFAAACALLVACRDRHELSFVLRGLAVTATAYAAISAPSVKGVLLGSVFFALAALLFFHAVLVVLAAGPLRARSARAASPLLAAGLVIPALALAAPGPRLPDHPFLERGSLAHRDAAAVNENTYLIAVDAREQAGARAVVYPRDLAVVSFGPAVSAYFEYHALVANRRLDVADLSSEAAVREQLPQFLCVSIAEDALEWIRFQDRQNAPLIEALRADRTFEERYRRDVRAPDGTIVGAYHLFCRR